MFLGLSAKSLVHDAHKWQLQVTTVELQSFARRRKNTYVRTMIKLLFLFKKQLVLNSATSTNDSSLMAFDKSSQTGSAKSRTGTEDSSLVI